MQASQQPGQLSNLQLANAIAHLNSSSQNAASNQQQQNQVSQSIVATTVQMLQRQEDNLPRRSTRIPLLRKEEQPEATTQPLYVEPALRHSAIRLF